MGGQVFSYPRFACLHISRYARNYVAMLLTIYAYHVAAMETRVRIPFGRYFSLRKLSLVGISGLAAGVLLNSCTENDPQSHPITASDPITTSALNDPLMSDPDLVSQNLSDSAYSYSVGAPLPVFKEKQGSAIDAHQDALMQLGGLGKVITPPQPVGDLTISESEALDALGRLTRLGVSESCLGSGLFSAQWMAKLRAGLALYPRAQIREAVGANGDGCNYLAGIYRTRAATDDILAFHYTMAVRAKYRLTHTSADRWHSLEGKGPGGHLEITVHTRTDGLNEVGLAWRGGASPPNTMAETSRGQS